MTKIFIEEYKKKGCQCWQVNDRVMLAMMSTDRCEDIVSVYVDCKVVESEYVTNGALDSIRELEPIIDRLYNKWAKLSLKKGTLHSLLDELK